MLNFDDLPKESKKLFCILYKKFLKQYKETNSISKASYIGDSDYIQETLYPKLSIEDVSSICWELQSLGYIECYPGDDLACEVSITSEARAFMQHRFKNNIKEISKFISQFI